MKIIMISHNEPPSSVVEGINTQEVRVVKGDKLNGLPRCHFIN